jgi:hypothetical protein
MKRKQTGEVEPVCVEGTAEHSNHFASALSKIAKAGAVSSRAAIEASKATKPSRHTRFVYNPAKDRA